MNWEQLPNGKWRPQKKPIAPGKIDPDSPDYERRVKAGLKKKWVYCEDCKAKYNLADPCIHHLTDSPRDRKKYEIYKKSRKEKAMSVETTRQGRL